MKKVNILTKGFTSPNGSAFLFPLIKHRRALKECGFDINFYFKKDETFNDADIIVIDSKFYRKRWALDTPGIIEEFYQFKKNASRVIYFDISDSSGWPHARILPYVDAYVKNQLLKEHEEKKKHPLADYNYLNGLLSHPF